ncbi:hypothetical protein STANM309S_01225 [Streptomyces tanashiensis]
MAQSNVQAMSRSTTGGARPHADVIALNSTIASGCEPPDLHLVIALIPEHQDGTRPLPSTLTKASSVGCRDPGHAQQDTSSVRCGLLPSRQDHGDPARGTLRGDTDGFAVAPYGVAFGDGSHDVSTKPIASDQPELAVRHPQSVKHHLPGLSLGVEHFAGESHLRVHSRHRSVRPRTLAVQSRALIDHWSCLPGFDCVIAYDGDEPAGYAYGAPAVHEREGWTEYLSPAPDATDTFNLAELMVRPLAAPSSAAVAGGAGVDGLGMPGGSGDAALAQKLAGQGGGARGGLGLGRGDAPIRAFHAFGPTIPSTLSPPRSLHTDEPMSGLVHGSLAASRLDG